MKQGFVVVAEDGAADAHRFGNTGDLLSCRLNQPPLRKVQQAGVAQAVVTDEICRPVWRFMALKIAG
jgi:hypothetical protein